MVAASRRELSSTAQVADRLGACENDDFEAVRVPAPLLAMMPDDAREELIAVNPLYGIPVCKCCHVSEGELVDALHRALPVKSLDALKWRTGATMGPCHGGRCTARIMQIMQRELGTPAHSIQKRQQGSNLVVSGQTQSPSPQTNFARKSDDQQVETGRDVSSVIARRCADLARNMSADLESRGLREVGSGSLGIAGTRPSGVYAALQALELVGATACLPGRTAVVWGTHDLALRATLALADAGVDIKCVLETGSAPSEPSDSMAILDELTRRGISVRYQSRVCAVSGANRLESVSIMRSGTCELVTCDLLVASPYIVSASPS